METQAKTESGRIDLTLSGNIDLSAAEELKRTIQGLNLTDVREIVIDMGQVTYIGSAGVGKLLLLYKNFPAADGQIHLANLSPEIHSRLSEMDLGSVFTLRKG